MQERLNDSPGDNRHLLNIIEALSVLGAIGGSIASLVTQQVAFASIPLSLSVGLNLVNRRRILDSVNQSNQPAAIAQLTQDSTETQAKLGTLAEQFAQEQQRMAQIQQHINDLDQGQATSNQAVTQLKQENAEAQTQLKVLTEQLAQVQELTTNLSQMEAAHQINSSQGMTDLQNRIQSLRDEQTKIAETVGYLREIETYTQATQASPNSPEAHYNRGFIYQQLENKEAAIGDYTEAIRIDPSYAQAYYARGLAHADRGDRKGAVQDLREAAKLFFDQGDIANYQTARDLSKQFHELSSQSEPDAPEVASLFS